MTDRADELKELMEDVKDVMEAAERRVSGAEPQPRTLLEVWRVILSGLEKHEKAHITMEVADQIVNAHPRLRIQDVPTYHRMYFYCLREFRSVLLAEIESDPECLTRAENDAEENAHHYLNLLIIWQQLLHQWDEEWECSSTDAHIEMAAIGSAANFILGENGLAGHLDAINFDYSDEDAAAVGAAIAGE